MKKKTLNLFFAILFIAGNSFGQKMESTIQNYLNENIGNLGLTKSDISNWEIYDQHRDDRRNLNYVYIRQTHNNLAVYNAIANFVISDDGTVISGNRLVKDVENKVNTTKPTISASDAVLSACKAIGIDQSGAPQLISSDKNEYLFEKGSISQEDIPVILMMVPDGDVIKLAWDLSIYIDGGEHWWSIRIDALTGEEINRTDWVTNCKFDSDENHNHSTHTNGPHYKSYIPSASPLMAPAPPPGTDQYRVFALPLESPNHGNRSLVVGPYDPMASPYGWHDDDGVAGNDYTTTRGNNVRATEDENDNNGFGYSPDGGASLNFDFTLNMNQTANNYWDPAVTNLFYMNNMMHDVWYHYGFDEFSGNFQENNYGNGGAASDYVYAEAQDGGGTNNANFATPADGSNPRMQMYLWTNTVADLLTINSPAGIAGTYSAIPAGFGGAMPAVPLTTDFVIFDDGVPLDDYDACSNAINGAAINGKICIIRRGDCTFVDKVNRAQTEGAVAVIMVNNVAGGPITMGGTDPGITIPAIMVSDVDGAAIIAAIEGGATVNGTIVDAPVFDLDGDFDNGIISHEYGHGISTRLTGGASNSNCLNNAEQMGEGWSDWFALMLTIEPGDVDTDNRGIGTFVTGETTNGIGIRPAPYNVDFAVNNYTYDATNNTGSISEPHGIGFVWCTMLWDMTWALIDQYGYDPDLYNGTGGNNIAMELVIQGLKLQPCSPGFVDGRDAILQADQLLNGGANLCLLWNVFATRGLGDSATQGNTNSRTDQVEAFDLPPGFVNVTGSASVTSCGDYTWSVNGTTYTTGGAYVETILSSTGCDSTATLNLTITPNSSSSLTETNCNNYTWAANGTTYTNSGLYTTTLVNSLGCDSIATLDLTIINSTLSTLNITNCDSYTWAANGNNYTTSGLYFETLVNSQGCDSIANLDLTITNTTTNTETASNCISYTWATNGTTYTNSGLYTTTLVNSMGCDSIVTLDLTINNPYNEVQNVGSCVPFTWPADGNTYAITGTHVANLLSVSGCDSTVTLNLTISTSAFSEQTIANCISYTWPTNGTTYTTTGVYSETLLAGSGCDSIVQLNLTINTPTVSSESVTVCDSYLWPADGQTYSANGSYVASLINSNGCDSTATLNLTILASSPTTTDVVNDCDDFTWSANGSTYTASGLYTETFQNTNGCDSIVELDLSLSQSTFSTENVTNCNDYIWAADGMTYTTSGTYQTVLTNSQGCDSTLTLALIVNNVDVSTSYVDDLTLTANLSGASYVWVDCNNSFFIMGGGVNQMFTAVNNGDYAVVVTDNGCSDTSACMNVNSVGVAENDFGTEINVYPNPTGGKVTIDLGADYSNVEIRVTNALGQIIDEKIITSTNSVDLNLEGARGTYILEITTNEGVTARVRVVKD